MFLGSVHLSKPNLRCGTTHCKKRGSEQATDSLLKTATWIKSTPSHSDLHHISRNNLQSQCFVFYISFGDRQETGADIGPCHFRSTTSSESLTVIRNRS